MCIRMHKHLDACVCMHVACELFYISARYRLLGCELYMYHVPRCPATCFLACPVVCLGFYPPNVSVLLTWCPQVCALPSHIGSLWPTRPPCIPFLRRTTCADRPLRLLNLQVTKHDLPDVQIQCPCV